MKIKSIATRQHKILGNIKVCFDKDSEPYKGKDCFYLETDDAFSAENRYTFIIGQNGAGKSVLFKTIVFFINEGCMQPQIYRDYLSVSPVDGKHRWEHSFGYLWNENHEQLFKYINGYLYQKKDFLARKNAQLLYLSSAQNDCKFQKPNKRFSSFNSEGNSFKQLLLKALIDKRNSSRLKQINRYIGKKENAKWQMEASLAADASGGVDKGRVAVLLSNFNNFSIFNFLSLIKKLASFSGGDFNSFYEGLDAESAANYSSLHSSNPFRVFFLDAELSLSALAKKIRRSLIFEEIEAFLTTVQVHQESKNIICRKNHDMNFLKKIIFEHLSDFDVDILCLLEGLRLINLKLCCDGVSVDDMSSGEKALLRIFSFFANRPMKSLSNIICLYDEPENSLHPKWQHDFLKYFRWIAEDVYGIKNSHFIFATHSPLLIMNVPKIKDASVICFQKNNRGKISSHLVSDINEFSIEEVLLDEFKVRYREKSVEAKLNKKLRSRKDPIESVLRSYELREKINSIYERYGRSCDMFQK